MSEQTPQDQAPAGWYRDPSGAPVSRWWDGTRWTEHTAPPVASAQPSSPAQPFSPATRPQLEPATPVYTWYIWAIVLVPLLGLPLTLLYTPRFRYVLIGPEQMKTIDPFSVFTPGYFIVLGIGLVFYGVTVVLAYLDRRELARRGVVRPFHWAWTFLYSPVYVVGRSVVVNGVAPKRGLWPLWVYLGVIVVVFAVSGFREQSLLHGLYR